MKDQDSETQKSVIRARIHEVIRTVTEGIQKEFLRREILLWETHYTSLPLNRHSEQKVLNRGS